MKQKTKATDLWFGERETEKKKNKRNAESLHMPWCTADLEAELKPGIVAARGFGVPLCSSTLPPTLPLDWMLQK